VRRGLGIVEHGRVDIGVVASFAEGQARAQTCIELILTELVARCALVRQLLEARPSFRRVFDAGADRFLDETVVRDLGPAGRKQGDGPVCEQKSPLVAADALGAAAATTKTTNPLC